MGCRIHSAIRNPVREGAALLALLLFACGPASGRIILALANALDGRDRFRVLNICWPPDVETVAPEGATGPVERLVPLRREGDTIVRDLDRPIPDLRADGDQPMHNWKGVARWGATGFLLVTDSYPENLLARVAIPD